MSSSKQTRADDPDAEVAALGDACVDAGGVTSRDAMPTPTGGVVGSSGRGRSAPFPSVPSDTGLGASSSLGEGNASSSGSSSDEAMLPTDSLEQLLTRLAKHQHELLSLPRDAKGKVMPSATQKGNKLKQHIKELKESVTSVLPADLHPLFYKKAALYRSIGERTAALGELLIPNPDLHTIRDKQFDREQVRYAVQALYESRSDARGFGTFVGYPGTGKTYLCRLLLYSKADSELLLLLDAEVQKWWRSQSVFVTSFNGITAASSDDLKLADLDSRVPCMVRLLHSEMMQTKDRSPDFSAFRAAVLDLLFGSKLSVSVLLRLVRYVMQTRRRRGLKSTPFVGVLLIDELVQLSLLPPLSPPRRRRKRRSPENEEPQQPTLSSSSGSPHDGAQCVFNARVLTPASTSSALHPGAGDRVDAQDAAVAVQTVEAARRAVCDIARAHRLCACITSLSDRFIRRQAAISSSVPVPIGTFQLVEAERVADAVRRMLISSDKGFQVTIRSDTISVLDTEVVAVCLGVLAGGHPRAAEILIEAIKTSRDGQPYLGRVLDMLEPDKLSLAGSSIDLLCAHPIIVAVGLMGYEVDPKKALCDGIDWDDVYSEGALTRGVTSSTHTYATRAASSAIAAGCPSYSTRMNVAFLLEALQRKAAAARIGNAVGGRSSGAADAGENLYKALQGVRAGLESGHAPMAWERFVLSALVVVSMARSLCSSMLDELVRDGQRQPAPCNSTLLDLFPASPPYLSCDAWLEETTVDVSSAMVGIRLFKTFEELFAKDETALLSYVWQPDSPNFPAVDGVIFVRCVLGGHRGPRPGELVAVMLQLKDRQQINMKLDIITSAKDSMQALRSASTDSTWARRAVFIVISRRTLPSSPLLDLTEAAAPPVIVVDESGLAGTFGPGLHALVRSSAVAFGTQVVDITSTRFPSTQA